MTVNQFHSGVAVGDAITNQMLLLERVIKQMGYDSSIYAEYIPNELANRIKKISDFRDNSDNILIIHHSMGISDKAFDSLKRISDKKILIYHNITPERFFEDEGTKLAIRKGLKQLEDYASIVDYYIADSNFNRRDMIHCGFKNRIDVLPVSISLDRFDKIESDKKILSVFENTNNVLFVGRVVANKRQVDLVKVFYYYKNCFDHDSKLILVGSTDNRVYTEEVIEAAKSLGLSDSVIITGKVSEEALKAYYQSAKVFLCMSEHEGFGVPILEAMKMDVPVLALRSSAIAETMGGGGVLANRVDYVKYASMIDELIVNTDFRNKIINRQRLSIAKKNSIDNELILRKAIDTVLGRNTRNTSVQMQGPFETSYSLAIVNRKLIESIDNKGGYDASIYCTEGPGDYQPKEKDLKDKPQAILLWKKSDSCPYPDVVIRNMFPPRVHDANGGLNFQCFGWEESIIPQKYIDNFNRYLDGVGTMSDYVTQRLIECGLRVPVKTIGIGVELCENYSQIKPYNLKTKKRKKFLHISSAFPRKGVDVLLAAYYEAFTKKDDVCLVLKTFPNPHNNVDVILDELNKKYPDGPEVEWINEDLPQETLESLYKAADCYVSVSRGEGFGLPVAEAMLARLPVIVSNNTGMTDFCNEKTALLVGFDYAEAKTHLSEYSNEFVSLWTEPHKDELIERMREFVACPTDALKPMTDAAFDLISEKFSWNSVTDRWVEFIQEVENKQFIPKVGMVTTWNNQCGIAEYTRMQIEASERFVDYKVYPSYKVQLLRADESFVEKRVWKNHDDLMALVDLLKKSDRDIIHIQFHFGFFLPESLSEMIDKLVENGKRVVITFHKTSDTEVFGKLKSLRPIVDALNKCSMLVVHQQEDVDRLVLFGVHKETIRIIPLGQLVYPYTIPTVIKKKAGIVNSLVIGSYGFFLPHKGILEVIRAMPLVIKKFPDALYIPVCAQHSSPESATYIEECKCEIEKLGLQNHVRLETRFLRNEDSLRLLQMCDVLSMAYLPSNESASGAIRFCIAARRPTITTKQPIFNEFIYSTYQIDDADPKLLADAIVHLAECKETQSYYLHAMNYYVGLTNWNQTSEKYKKVYLEVLGR